MAFIYLFYRWSYLLYQTVKHFASGRDIASLWNEVRPTLMIFQNAAVLEVIYVLRSTIEYYAKCQDFSFNNQDCMSNADTRWEM